MTAAHITPAERAEAMARCEAAFYNRPQYLTSESKYLYTLETFQLWQIADDAKRLEATLRAVEAERDAAIKSGESGREYWSNETAIATERWAKAEFERDALKATIASLSADLAKNNAENLRSLAEVREKLTMHLAHVGAWLSSLCQFIGEIDITDVNVAITKIHDKVASLSADLAQAKRRNEQHTAAYDEIASDLARKEAENAELRGWLIDCDWWISQLGGPDDEQSEDLPRELRLWKASCERARLAAEAGKK